MHIHMLPVRIKNIDESLKIYITQDLHPDFIFYKDMCVNSANYVVSDGKITFILSL
jgi:hypothetical protein